MSAQLSGTNTIETSTRANVVERVAIATPLATFVGVAFLYSYMVFHALHVAKRDPQIVKLLSPIPLFATCAAAALTGLVLGSVATLFALADDRVLTRLPKLLGIAAVLFTIEIVLFP
jgi:hypothetical protein